MIPNPAPITSPIGQVQLKRAGQTEIEQLLRDAEVRLTQVWTQYFTTLGVTGSGGGGGAAQLSGQDVSGAGQVITVPFPPPSFGSFMILRLTTTNLAASITWGPEFDPAADTRINFNLGGSGVFVFYGDDRGSGVLWYLASAPYMWPV